MTSYTIDVPNASRRSETMQPPGCCWQLEPVGDQHVCHRRHWLDRVHDARQLRFTGGGERCGNNLGQFPIVTGDARLPRGDRSIDRWFDTSVFKRPSGRGDVEYSCSTDHITLPGFHNHDISIFKNFPLRGNHKVQFRWEIYNLFDQLSFNEVDTGAIFDAQGNQVDANFGKVTSARTERRMQFSLRYSF